MTWDRTIPFDKDGNQLGYADGWPRPHEMRVAEPFTAALTYRGYRKGRSSFTFEMVRMDTGTVVHVFATDIDDIVPLMVNGTVSGTWEFCKRGQNYGCRLVRQ